MLGGITYRKINNLNGFTLCSVFAYVIYVSSIKQKGNKNLVTIIAADNDKDKIKINIFFSEKHREFIESLTFGTIIKVQKLRITRLETDKSNNIGKGDLDDNERNFNIVSIAPQCDITRGDLPTSTHEKYSWDDGEKKICIDMKNKWENYRSTWAEHLKATSYNITSHTTIAQPFNNSKTTGASSKTKFTYTSIENLKPNTFVSLVAKILEKTFIVGNGGKRATIKLWDGTGQDVIWVNDQPTLGNTIFANTWEQGLINDIDALDQDSWVTITGAKVTLYKDILEIKLYKNSKIFHLDDNDLLVQTVLKNYRIKCDVDTNDYGKNKNENNNDDNDDNDNSNDEEEEGEKSSRKKMRVDGENDFDDEEYDPIYRDIKVTETHYPHIATTTVADVLSKDQKVPNKFKLNVSLSQHIPLNIQDFSRIHCKVCQHAADYYDSSNTNRDQDLISCSACGSSQTDYIFLFKLILKDSTGEIPIIFANHANYFLNMIPCSLYNNRDRLSSIESKLKILKKPNLTFDICIMSYYESGKERLPENVKYQAFDTKLTI
ncbi:hypothetical protein RB653_000329 [Dictyostelium firmibasis]|uniref:Protection of telomeres protein 1 n=1 Tax=Dictyostelium firmibasis TaxID=79012 RepID=A0AAN7U2J9_9MYCE